MTKSGHSPVSRPPSLTERAYEALSRGPSATRELASHVLGLSGNAGAVSAAVFTLLGKDDRFEVGADGLWRLSPGAQPPGPDLDRLKFAVVDVETTGGPYSRGHRMTEFASVRVERGQVASEYTTLLNPGRSIPPLISGLTGIFDGMVARAPYFEQVASRVYDEIEGCVFVAHNVGFDWTFVRGELAESVGVPSVPQLCTVRMARRLVPELKRRNLDALADHYDIPIFDRHRAYGDAMATARVLIRLLDAARANGIRDLRALERYVNRPTKRRRKGRRRPRHGFQA